MTVMPEHARAEGWTVPQAALGAAVGVLGVAVAILGFIDIYLTITHLLHAIWGDWAWTVIVLGEGSAAGSYLGWLLLDLKDRPPRRVQVFLAVYLTAFMAGSLVLNLYAGRGSVPGLVSHAVVVAAFFGYLIFVKILVARLSADARTRAMEQAVTDARRHAIDLCRDQKGVLWRFRVPSLLRRQILTGRLPDEVRVAVAEHVRAGRTAGWEAKVREWVFRELRIDLIAAAASEKAARDIAASTPPGEPESAPEARPGARPETRSGPALKLAASKSRGMSSAELEPHVTAMLEAYGTVSEARVKKDLHVGTEKAREALRLAKGGDNVVSIGHAAAVALPGTRL